MYSYIIAQTNHIGVPRIRQKLINKHTTTERCGRGFGSSSGQTALSLPFNYAQSPTTDISWAAPVTTRGGGRDQGKNAFAEHETGSVFNGAFEARPTYSLNDF